MRGGEGVSGMGVGEAEHGEKGKCPFMVPTDFCGGVYAVLCLTC